MLQVPQKNIIHQLYRNPLALCQCPVNTDGIQPVKTGDPEQNRNDKNNNKIPDFLLVMLRTSPTKRLEYLLKFPPFDRIARPIATEQEEKTEIIVSVDTVLLLPILFNSSANTTAKITMEIFVSGIPHTTPTAIPSVRNASRASEKYAIFY